MAKREKYTRRNIRNALNRLIRLQESRKRGLPREYMLKELKLIREQIYHGRREFDGSTTQIVPRRKCIRIGCGHHEIKHRPFCSEGLCVCDKYMSPSRREEILY